MIIFGSFVIALFLVFSLTPCFAMDKDSPFGVLEFLHWNHSWNNNKYPDKKSLKRAVSLMEEAGVSWVRMDFLWGEIEPKKGVFNFDKYDGIVELLVENDINVLGILNYSADWASVDGRWNGAPSDNKLFVDYATAVVARYKDKIKYWEIWNEPDSHIYWAPQDGLKAYCALLGDVYAALKQVDQECKVLNGGLASGISGVNRLYDNGARDYFDILNIHIFESPLTPGADKRIVAYPKLAYKIMGRNGDADKKIWVTEIGLPGVKKGVKVKNWWMGENPSEEQQARWVEVVYEQLLKVEAVDKVFWAFLRDTNAHWNDGTDYFGLLRWDFSRKPAFGSYKKAVRGYKR